MQGFRAFVFLLSVEVRRGERRSGRGRREACPASRPVPDRTVEDAFAEGLAQGYYEVISLMHLQAEAFGIPLTDLALEDLDPERDLI